ncbi:MAG: cobalt ECF transporter T component CbiQ [Anaerofustis sp.]
MEKESTLQSGNSVHAHSNQSKHNKQTDFASHRHAMRDHDHTQGITIDQYAYRSGMRDWNPVFKVSFAVIVLILCIAYNQPYVSCLIILTMGYLSVIKGNVPLRTYLSLQRIPLTFILLGTIAIGIDFSKDLLGPYHLYIGFGYLYTTTAKLKEMLFLIIKVFAAVNALQMMTLSTPASEIITVMKRAHVPKLIIELMHMIYRYIFILLEVYNRLRNSAESRLGYCDFRTSCATFGHVAGNLFLIAMKKANFYYDAMESRCYDGEFLFLESEKKLKAGQLAIAFVFLLILTAVYLINK